jgi:hypothetical protein
MMSAPPLHKSITNEVQKMFANMPDGFLDHVEVHFNNRLQPEDNMNLYRLETNALAAHECGHAVCALANGVQVVKIQNGVRHQFTLYDKRTFPNTQVRKLVSLAGPVAESEFLKQIGLKSDVCSAGDVAHLLGHEESDPSLQGKLTTVTSYEKDSQVSSLQASLDDHLMNGKDLPYEFQDLLGLVEQVRVTLTEHRNSHSGLVAGLFDKGGVLRMGDIQRIWKQTHSSPI